MALTLSSISKCFTEEILQQVVVKALNFEGKVSQKIKSHSVESGAEKGTGYLGIVYRIRVHLLDDSELTLIGKGMPPNMVRRKTFRCEPFFAKEVLFFNQLAPMFHEFEQKKRGAEKATSDPFLPIANCYYAMSDGMNDFLVFQDLKTLDYGMADRISGPTEVQRTSLLQTLARFHALSMALHVDEPEKFTNAASELYESWFSQEVASVYDKYMYKLYKIWHRALENEIKGTEYWERFEKFGADTETLFRNLCGSVRLIQPAVINHGDAWSTNFLFKEDKVMMIDFQLVRYCSPMTDLSMFIFSCTTEEQRAAAGGMEKILKDYYQVLCDAVGQLGMSKCPLSWEQLKEQWSANGLLGFGCCLELVLLSLVETEDVQDLDRVEGDKPIPLVELTQFKDITDAEGKKRLADLVRLAVDYNMF